MIPPPLAAVTVQFPASLQCIGFLNSSVAEAIAGLSADGTLSIVWSVEEDLWEETAEEQAEPNTPDPQVDHQLTLR